MPAIATVILVGWVLWQSVLVNNTDSGDWQPAQATAEMSGCEATMAKTIDEFIDVYRSDGAVTERKETSFTANYSRPRVIVISGRRFEMTSVLYEFKCLPDTIDPRGPKGK